MSGLLAVLPTVAAIVAAVAAGRAAARCRDTTTGCGWAVLALVAATWAAEPLGGPDSLVPAAALVAAAGVFLLTGGSNTAPAAAKARIVVDALIVTCSLLLAGWGPDGSALGSTASGVAVIGVVLATSVGLGASGRTSWLLLAGAFVLLGTRYGVVAQTPAVPALTPADLDAVGRTLSALLLAGAAVRRDALTAPLGQVGRLRAGWLLVLYVPLLVALGSLARRTIGGPVDPTHLGLAGALVAALLARVILAQWESISLTRERAGRSWHVSGDTQRHHSQLRSLVEHASDVLTIIDDDHTVRYQSAAATAVLGCSPTQLFGQAITTVVHPDDLAEFEAALAAAPVPPATARSVAVRFLRADLEWAATETTITDLTSDPGVAGLLLAIRDVSDRKHLEEQLRHDALHDPLTGLGNRVLFQDRLSHATARAARNPHAIAVLLLDLDGFKDINDTLGHDAGDRLLCEVADRLRQTLRPGDTVARVGGDEFAVLLERSDPGVPELVAGRILAGLRAPVDLGDGHRVVPLGSIGVAAAATDHTTAEELLRAADLAMHRAKDRGKGCLATFEDGMQQAARLRVELENDLRRAIRQDELVLHYQPIVEVPSGRVSGVEALVRWVHPQKGLIPPNDFIPVAEDSDLVVDLGRWVLRTAANQLKVWHERFPAARPFSMSVNVATRQLLSPWFVQEVDRVLSETGIDPSSLILEITEGALMSDLEPTEATLRQLRDLGVRLAIDDFGTGWSSLSRLRSFPVNKLKIDRAFVREIVAPDDSAPLVAAIIAMAHSLGLLVVAEGVETVDQLACLSGLGCGEVQGYLLSRPVVTAELERLLEAPGGLLGHPDQLTDEATLTEDDQELMEFVASAAAAARAYLPPAMLTALLRSSGMDAVYLTRVCENEALQEVVSVSDEGDLRIASGTTIPLRESPCGRMLAGGPKTSCPTKEFPRHPVAAAGARAHLTVAVRDEDGGTWGTLCGVSRARVPIGPSLVVLFELFSKLITQHLFDERAPEAGGAALSDAAVAPAAF